MSKILLLAGLFLGLQEWILISDEKAGFSLLFPSKVSLRSDSLDVDIGMAFITTISCSLGEGLDSKIFLANHMKYPDFIDMEKDSMGYYISETILEQMKNQLFNGKLLYNSSTIINGMSAQLCALQYGTDSSMVRMAIIMHKNSLMSLQYYSALETGINKEAEKFFYSCKLQ